MRKTLLNIAIFIYRQRGFLLRALLAYILGLFLLSGDEVDSYDLRLQLRGQQAASTEIVLITLSPSDVNFFFANTENRLQPLPEIADVTDSFFWNRKAWNLFLQELLKYNPKALGVTIFFSESLSFKMTEEEEKLFKDPRIVWLGSIFQNDYPLWPMFANRDHSNVGFADLMRDNDGKVRRFSPTIGNLPEFVTKISQVARPKLTTHFNIGSEALINFRGGQAFTKIPFSEIITQQVSPDLLKNKIILIGTETQESNFITPVGQLSRSELLAHYVDNITQERRITRLPYVFYASYLLLTLLLMLVIFRTFPQTVALVFSIFIGLLLTSVSVWLFDSFKLWLPVVSVGIQNTLAWMLFVSYMTSKIERKNWKLEQEQKSLAELEQLKSNFVSLISHDLNTPIAKIKAIVDRLGREESPQKLNDDIHNLRMSTEELSKYIQSILRVLRVESREFKLNYEVADVNELLDSAIESLKPIARMKEIEIQVHLEPLFSVELDVTLMREVFANVIENAIKYTPNGGTVTVSSTEVDDIITITVRDTGEGISKEDLATVFGKFVRGKNQDLKSKGTGLGLYLVKYFTELHGGSVNLESELGKHTTVILKLPTAQAEEMT